MSEDQEYPLSEALKALQALRTAGGLPPETFPIPAFVGMISDEVESLRKRGKTDAEIASLVESNSAIRITAEQIGQFYASPEERHHHGE